jgi:anaphase-promoting complex subunit 5
MARFLTPTKIGLLALIELYTESIVSNTSTLPILSFILAQVLPPTLNNQLHNNPTTNSSTFILNLKSFEELLSAHVAASGLPGRTLWDHFLRKLWDIDSLDALHVFFANRSSLLAKSKEELKKDSELGILLPAPEVVTLSPTSPFGTFVRRSKVEFERLRFSDALALWTSFTRWRAESKSYWARKNGGLGRWAGDRALSDGEEDWGSPATEMLELIAYGDLGLNEETEGTVSTDDVEKLLEFQVEQMQSWFLSHSLKDYH